MELTKSQLQIKQGLTNKLLHDSSQIIEFWIDFGNKFNLRSYIPGSFNDKEKEVFVNLRESYIMKLEEYAKTLPEYERLKDIY